MRCAICLLLVTGCQGYLSIEPPETATDGGGIRITLDDAATPGGDAWVPPGTDAGADASTPPRADAGPPDPCAGVICGANSNCDPRSGSCSCDPGFVSSGGACVAPPAGDPAGRSAAEVCARWNGDHAESSPSWIAGAGCDPGTMPQAAIDDTVRRVSLFRWLAGLPPVAYDGSDHQGMMECARMMDANGSLSHSPPSSWQCYTAGGAGAAGRSNIALGYPTSASSVDGYMEDDCGGTQCNLGHRRWILSTGLGAVEVGSAGRGHCLGVFRGGGSSDRPWTAYPNPGPSPIDLARAAWSVQANTIDLSSATVRVVRASDGVEMPVEPYFIGGGFGPPSTLAWEHRSWAPSPGERYQVTLSGTSAGEIRYEVHVVGC
ncbi:MAG: hypothetical protein IT378_15040 [Sandaracinaceae bacterium]|nr:hypothetical protein [Sandaracinaceae bacterium]